MRRYLEPSNGCMTELSVERLKQLSKNAPRASQVTSIRLYTPIKVDNICEFEAYTEDLCRHRKINCETEEDSIGKTTAGYACLQSLLAVRESITRNLHSSFGSLLKMLPR